MGPQVGANVLGVGVDPNGKKFQKDKGILCTCTKKLKKCVIVVNAMGMNASQMAAAASMQMNNNGDMNLMLVGLTPQQQQQQQQQPVGKAKKN